MNALTIDKIASAIMVTQDASEDCPAELARVASNYLSKKENLRYEKEGLKIKRERNALHESNNWAKNGNRARQLLQLAESEQQNETLNTAINRWIKSDYGEIYKLACLFLEDETKFYGELIRKKADYLRNFSLANS
ncbi:hypothetical protein CMO88_04220 [Candidatus Woesearchaeota archaeon]|jgi:hypothetical protein|nr:hypothetical protein [Candidatus Woesearchaeota archaeon]|tara:strand:- start:8157 stop:8564 length:408 start_codon:yes stop_codon:yes gene_type:complete